MTMLPRKLAKNDALRRNAPWVAALLFAVLYYVPYALPPTYRVFPILDYLNCEIVYNIVIGSFWRNSSAAEIFLSGQLPMFFLNRLTQPLTLLYALATPYIAALAVDGVARVVGFVGFYLLARYYALARWYAVACGALFALSIANTSFGLSVAGLPLALVLALVKRKGRGAAVLAHFIVFMIGANTSLILSGFAVVLAWYPLLWLLRREEEPFDHRLFATYVAGLLIGNAGLVWVMLSAIDLHRSEMIVRGTTFGFKTVFINTMGGFGHVAYPMHALLAFALVTIGKPNMRRHLLLLFCYFAVVCFPYVYKAWLAQLQHDWLPMLRSIQFDRVYWLSSFLLMMTVVIGLATPSRRRTLGLGLLVLQGAYFLYCAPAHKPLLLAIANKPLPTAWHDYYATWDAFFKPRAYAEIHKSFPNARFLSVGLDPMAAAANGLRVADGYHNLYPLAYKHRFYDVIKAQIEGTEAQTSFQSWGSRVLTFVSKDSPLRLDFCAAQRLGVTHLIAAFPLDHPHLSFVLTTMESGLRVYELRCSE